MATFVEHALAHLARYKRERLGVLEDGIWVNNNRPYPHILPQSSSHLNIIESIRDDFFEYATRERITLHTNFHHLNSSQALCFNLFFSFVGLPTSDPALLLKALGVSASGLRSPRFEADSGSGDGTTFDFTADLAGGGRLLVEVKFTEGRFGQAKKDAAHEEKRVSTYVPILERKVTAAALEPKQFFPHYQLLRNVAHADPSKNHRVILLIPRENAALRSGLDFLKDAVLPTVKPMLQVVFLEDVFDRLTAQKANIPTALARHLELLIEKYRVPGDSRKRKSVVPTTPILHPRSGPS